MTQADPAITDAGVSTQSLSAFAPQLGVIVACLERIRTRLWWVRLLERCALAAACAGFLSLIFLCGRYWQWRSYPGWGHRRGLPRRCLCWPDLGGGDGVRR